MKRVAIIGGGFAGLSAGVELAARGLQVTVLEGRPRLGGRAYSFTDDATGEVVDNGQHAMMGCYTHTLRFLERIGATPKLHRQNTLRVEMLHRRFGAGAIACAALPSPLHMLSGILGYRLLRRYERWAALRAGLRLMLMHRRHDPRLAAGTVEEVLMRLGQSAEARASFWYPVAVATLNESPARAAAAPFAEVLARAFFGTRADSQFVLPKVGLSDLYTDDARRFIEARGGSVRTRASAATLVLQQERVEAIELRDGSRVEADACIAAVPPKALGALLPESALVQRSLAALAQLECSPIVSTHLWFDRPVLRSEFVGLVGTKTQWLFNRSRLTAQASADGSQCVSAVISAGRDVVEWDNARVAATVVADLRALIPAARAARLLRSVVVKEKYATIAPTPAAERCRPGAETALDNCFLAGDWINTGLPPTIESAVVSGQHAAALVAARLARH